MSLQYMFFFKTMKLHNYKSVLKNKISFIRLFVTRLFVIRVFVYSLFVYSLFVTRYLKCVWQ